MASNARVEGRHTAVLTLQVAVERRYVTHELLEDDCLSLDFAYLLSDNPASLGSVFHPYSMPVIFDSLLCHFLYHSQALLDDSDGLGMADKFLLLNNNRLLDR